MNLSDTVRKLAKDIAELTKLVMNIRAVSGGGITTGQNIGVGGVGVYHSVVANTMRFRTVNAASAQITVALDAVNNEVDIELGPHVHQAAGSGGQLDHGLALTGLADDDHTQYLRADGARALSANWDAGAAAGRTIQVGNLVAGGAVAAKEVLQTEDAFALKETSEPGADAGYGKMWVSSADGLPYFKDGTGVICGLCGGGEESGGGGGGFPYLMCGTTRRIMAIVAANATYQSWNCSMATSGTKAISIDDFTLWTRHTLAGANNYIRSTAYNDCRKSHSPTFYCRFRLDASVANTRMYFGLASTSLVALTDDPAAGHYALLRVSPNFANFYFITEGAGAQNETDSGLAIQTDTAYDLIIELLDGGNITFTLQEIGGSGFAQEMLIANLPDNSADMGMYAVGWCTSGTTYYHLCYMTLEAD